MNFLQHALRTDVTSLLLFDDYILSGMGGILSLFSVHSSELLDQLVIFQASRIHGLCKGSNNYFVVHGGKSVSIISCNPEMPIKLSIHKSWLLDDWIQSVQWLQDANVSIATAHNVVTLWNWGKGERILTAHCQEKCILYSAIFVGDTWDQLVLLAGTVFREVVIWSPVDGCNGEQHAAVLQRLQGHKGVIFSIHYNPEYDQIHTTSDDRSVKGWQVVNHHPNNWKVCKIELLYTLFGHTARVWKSMRLKKFTLSVGEDSQICVWNPEGALVKRWSMHQGGNIWSLACSEEKNMLVTGGSDGAINVLSLNTCENNQDLVFNIPLQEWCSEKSMEQCIPRKVVILRSGHFITILESGHLIICPADKHILMLNEELAFSETKLSGSKVKMLPWVITYYSPKLASYCLLETSQCRQLVALASLSGQILIFKDCMKCSVDSHLLKIVDISAADGKIYSLQWLSSTSILTCETAGKLTLWSLEINQDLGHHLMKMKTFVLPFSKERWVTAALKFENFLVCGDRLGNIHLYSMENEGSEIIEPCQSLFKVHGRLGVSSLLLHHNLIYSTGRNGTLAQYELSRNDCKLQLSCATRMLFEWVASVCVYAMDILVLGFLEKKFVVWSQQQQRLLFEVPCGGGHRSWDYLIKENMFTFVYIQHQSLCCIFCELTSSLKPILQTGFHPKEVNCVQKLHTRAKFPLFVSGGEDTAIRVTAVYSQSKFCTLVVLHSHISSVRTLTCSHFNEDTILMFSAGGNAQMKAWELKLENISDVIEELPTILCRELSSHLLMNQKQNKSWKVLQRKIDPETRYMSLCVIPHDKFFIAAGCSDGYLRLFQFYIHQPNFQLVRSFDFHCHCILNVASIAPSKIVSMATDGILAFWDLESVINEHLSVTHTDFKISQKETSKNDVYQPFSTFKIHQSGINCYAMRTLESNHLLLATGGDDTALVFCLFKLLDNPVSAYLVQQWRMESAHVAQITGVAFFNEYLISASVDQCIFMWKWVCDVNHQLILVHKVSEYFSTVTDIHGLNVWNTENGFSLSVHGKGFEIINILSTPKETNKFS